MPQLRIRRLTFRAGSRPGTEPLSVDAPNVTVLVGPNNSGKSITLRELEVWCQGENPSFKVIASADLSLPGSFADLLTMIKVHEAPPPANQMPLPDRFWVSRPVIRQGERALHELIDETNLKTWFDNANEQPLRQVFVKLFTLRLDGRTRFDLVDPKETGPLESPPRNHLWALFVTDPSREKVRQFTEDAFGRHFVIDPTGMTQFRARLSDRKPVNKAEEQALDATARAFHKHASLIPELGDGVRTSVGLVSAVMSVPDRILLIDEPEAFLHPTLARRVGTVLSTTARDRDASLIVATHSAEFLMGCIQATPELRIIRLTYAANSATARSIEPAEIIGLMNDPLLRSANALRALFHRAVIVTEADSDRAFYEEVNYRLQQAGRGISDALFMNAQNWQTIPRIVSPLRKLGIPAAAVVDFDVIMDENFQHIWPLLNLPAAQLRALHAERNTIKGYLDAKGKDVCKAQGLSAFAGAELAEVTAFVGKMKDYGLFFVPVGELECWLATLGIPRTRNKPKWLTDMFTRMGADPAAPGYVSAGVDDAWTFVEDIEAWIARPDRLGIPD
jgi:hypothetical protein